ncbi:hypothetical protein TWF106_002376 [Orbilia oligospora]|uniref:C2H2-type domain-containing protein n=1 Tax=Orbilia oligospora TaxID=2813651 RepID=A0A7C8U1W4_ORBOL|nr:hypothetical protein TWF788_006208 [Orbilia oligospora]KAF3202461.1 hypothetical protein TWF106_002376 [Orbilia oligospora]
MASKRPLSPQSWSTCARCKLEFYALDKAQEHFSTICYDLWCDLCQGSFEDPEKTRQHMSAHRDLSSRCPRCAFDAGRGGDIIRHWIETGCHRECPVCKVWYYQESYDIHLELNPYCRRVTFTSESTQTAQPSDQSEQQALVLFEPRVYQGTKIEKNDGMGTKSASSHPSLAASDPYWHRMRLPAIDTHPGPAALGQSNLKVNSSRRKGQSQVNCPGCNRGFPLPASLVSHLEAGGCPSMIDFLDINYTFATYLKAEKLLLSDNRKSLGSLLNYRDIQATRPFQCPGNGCGLTFSVLSGLIQHSDSDRCSASIGRPMIMHHLRTNVYYQSIIRKMQKMAIRGPTTMFVRPPPYQVDQNFLHLPERWGPAFSKLKSDLFSAVTRVSCGNPDKQGRNFLVFQDPHNMGNILQSIENSVTWLRGELGKIEPAQNNRHSNDLGKVLVCFGTTEETHSLYRFLNDVEKFKNVLRKELHETPLPLYCSDFQVS